jgi:hypothetical protein
MKKREIEIYNELFNKVCSKDELAKLCGDVSIKTIENTVKECDDIVYSKKLGAYHFQDLLPSKISYQNYFNLFQDNLSNPLLKKDMIKSVVEFGTDLHTVMIDTTSMSELSKKIIKTNMAINHNCIIKIYYPREGTPKKDKYIKPKQIITFDAIYYLTFEYDKRNKTENLEERPFAFNGIQSIEEVEYLKKSEPFRENNIGNSFGKVKDAKKKVTLKLCDHASYFFMREGLFESPYYKFIQSNPKGNELTMEMIYNDNIEVVKLVQQWMPLISVADDSVEAKEIIQDIKNNYRKFIKLL